jgi:hypothetical protein
MNRGLAAALLLSIAQACAIRTAWADSLDPPRYDSDTFCWLRSYTQLGFSDEGMAQCLGRQQLDYDTIRREWHELPDEIQSGCDEQTRLKDPLNYEALLSCIQMQKRRIPPAPAIEGDLPQ